MKTSRSLVLPHRLFLAIDLSSCEGRSRRSNFYAIYAYKRGYRHVCFSGDNRIVTLSGKNSWARSRANEESPMSVLRDQKSGENREKLSWS